MRTCNCAQLHVSLWLSRPLLRYNITYIKFYYALHSNVEGHIRDTPYKYNKKVKPLVNFLKSK
jgi:hypothetical protein